MHDLTTRAILIERLGKPEVLVEREVPLRRPNRDEVHVRVLAAGVNFADLMMREGLYRTVPPRPFSPGFEVAGEVVRVGSAVGDWQPGDRVVALLRHGGYSRDVVLPARQVFRHPGGLTAAEAAAIPVVFLTAWVVLLETGHVRAGETVLVLGAGGGVGTAAVQLARHHGLRVIATAGSQRKRDFVVKELGAEACFDSAEDWESEVRQLVGERGIDIALDPLGGSATAACRRLLAPLGRLVFYGLSNAMPRASRSWPRALRALLQTPWFHPLSLVEPNVGVFGVHLLHLGVKETVLVRAVDQIYDSLERGQVSPVLDRPFPLSRAGAVDAHRYIHARKNVGKVVLVSESD